MRGRELQLLGGIVAVAALARFATLDLQSYWYDEAVTVGLVRMDFGDMLSAIPDSESTPPLYYAIAWLWAKVFGTGEVGLRSLSAVCGTAFVPVMYAIGARAVRPRVGLIAAGLAAVNPLLVWYSQEARAYALLVLLAGLSFLFFIHLLTGDPRRRALVLWAAFSALALATHYFAAFLVALEATWLLATAANRRPVAIAVAGLTVVELAHLPLLLHQRSLNLADFIDDISLAYRLGRTPKQFLVGFDSPNELISAIAAGLLVLAAIWFVWSRGDELERRVARIGGTVGVTLLLGTALLGVVGVDYFDTRNVLVAWPPLAAASAAGFGAQRAGPGGLAAAAGLAALGVAVVLFVATDKSFQREDWRGVAAALHDDEPAKPRAVVVTPFTGSAPLAIYAPEFDRMPKDGAGVREVDFVALPFRNRTQSSPGAPPRPEDHPPPTAAFKLVETRFDEKFTLLRYVAAAPVGLTPEQLIDNGIDFLQPAVVLLEP